MSDFILNVIAGIVGILIVLFVDRSRRPVLIIEEGEISYMGPGDPKGRKEAAFPYIRVTNKSICPFLGFFFDREPAYACKAWITFLDMEKNKLYEKEMLGRWTKNPQPRINIFKKDDDIYRSMIVIKDTFDIQPNVTVSLNSIVRIKDDKNCYGWSDESYLEGWNNPNWKIQKKNFLLKIRIRTGGREFIKILGIKNKNSFKKIRFFSV